MNTTKNRYPSWWAYYHLARNAYFLLGIPCLLLYSAAYTSDLLDDNLRHSISLFILAYGCYFLLFIPPLWLYLRTSAKKKKVQQVVQQIKESSPFAPTSDYEQLSFSKSCYFGIDIKNGTMLYVRIYPNNVMDVIGLDIHNFTRTVAEDGKLEIHTTYVSLPMIPLEISGISARTLANTMHTMAARGYEYKERFPQMIRYRVKEWEKVAGVPVAEVF
ncbi:plasmid IncI1-type surface exclusion protein ExcA [Escherichia coli]|uniref:plasmid IncI1-type surface exclusion protein ExcA n=1 Tax=Escherichia coli TaxID=562 RepID=UPI00041992DC|nr:plasmid IncI1-type surface exclusion protein ExcA [Escherichia coli]EFK1546578.1 plasmid IncI1-type surface exclusion protein ExcA [Escherichia coli]EFL8592849.1 plasmid IncI1-type surface exclusion protein ExcA [Escherichia coli]EFN7005929.1 ethanolamine utilization protein EutE [Escherichia coli]EFQ9913300.1 plasmid IncI1-type surface exclusion protein ExcA [Escherichia coli]EFR2097003.1 plasmid IncI1-type surface exclusion protein ExcA [Escherichia coli]